MTLCPPHRWLVASLSVEGGGYFPAVCKRCGAERTFDADARSVPGYGHREGKEVREARRKMREELAQVEAQVGYRYGKGQG